MAIDTNSVILVGRLTRDVELRPINTSDGESSVADVSIAVNDGKKGEEELVSFFDVTVFGRAAEVLQKFSGKGKRILVKGRLKQEKWQDKESGENRYKVKVVCEPRGLQLLDYKDDKEGGEEEAAPAPRSAPARRGPPPRGNGQRGGYKASQTDDADDSDIPF